MAQITGIRTHIFIGGTEVYQCPRAWIESVRHRPLSRAGITLPDALGEWYRSISPGTAVEIRLGYRDQAPATWQGTVAWVKHGHTKDQITVGAVGVERPLCETLILQSWEDETPEAILKWAIGQAGLTAGRIDSPHVTFPRFVASDIPVWQVARQCAHTCRRAYDLEKMRRWAFWMGADGEVNWGDFDEPGVTPVIATAAGLIRHKPASDALGLNEVETFLLPAFRHSMLFRLVDSRRGIDDTFRALVVRHSIRPHAVRTFIRYGEEYGKF